MTAGLMAATRSGSKSIGRRVPPLCLRVNLRVKVPSRLLNTTGLDEVGAPAGALEKLLSSSAGTLRQRCWNRPLGGPIAQLINLFRPCRRERDCRFQLCRNCVRVQEAFIGVGGILCRFDSCLNFRAGKSWRGRDQQVEVELCRLELSFRELDGEDCAPLRRSRQVNKEKFVKATFADQLRRQRGNVVAGRGN